MPPVRLFIGNLPYQATEDDLRSHFSTVGEPTQIVRPLDRETGRARGFAFVEYADRAVAEEAIRKFDGQLLMGRPLAVSEARARDDRGPVGPRPPGSGYAPRPPAPGAMGPGGPPRPGGYTPSGPGGPPRPSGPGGFRPGGPGAGPGPGTGREFGPPAPPKGKGPKKDYRKEDAKPRGPIPTKFTGRMYDLDEVETEEDAAAADEIPEFMKPDAPAGEDDAAEETTRDTTEADETDDADDVDPDERDH